MATAWDKDACQARNAVPALHGFNKAGNITGVFRGSQTLKESLMRMRLATSLYDSVCQLGRGRVWAVGSTEWREYFSTWFRDH
jgi:hypothetical protein